MSSNLGWLVTPDQPFSEILTSGERRKSGDIEVGNMEDRKIDRGKKEFHREIAKKKEMLC